jgi:hypothetical protein
MSAPFEPGDVVVCVDVTPHRKFGPPDLKLGAYYRVTDYIDPPGLGAVVRVAGADHSPAFGGFRAQRFRKINDEQYPEVLEAILSCKKPERPALNPSRHYADGRGVQPA